MGGVCCKNGAMADQVRARFDDEGTPPQPPHNRRRWLFAAIPLGIAAASLLLPFASPIFPASEVESCTVTGDNFDSRRRNFIPKRPTDCGTFVARKSVTCTSDPSREVSLLTGYTYDLTVRGPRIPLLSVPVVDSAILSRQQARVQPSTLGDGDDLHSEAARELMEQFSPENLRAFDYEQPPFDPSCDPSRNVMTSVGIQAVTPADALVLLTPPAGETPRAPLLPCSGFQCGGR